MSQYKFLADNKGPYFGAGEDGHINQGFYQARVANPVVTWEKAKTLNLGLSTQFLNGK
jgi:TonB-dependent starch-binding outer membrane protein SusC